MTEPPSTALPAAAPVETLRPPLQLVRLPVDKPQPAVSFLHQRSAGVMDLIAHFWERLAQTPPLLRADLHLVVATAEGFGNLNINISQIDPARFAGAMLYVPKAHRADVLALDPAAAAAFAAYIRHQGLKSVGAEPQVSSNGDSTAGSTPESGAASTLSLTDLSIQAKNGTPVDSTELPAETGVTPGLVGGNNRVPIDFLTGGAEGIAWMTSLLLPLVHKRQPARQLVNVVMQLPPDPQGGVDPNVRLATSADVPTLNRWRRQYKDERGIVFDADMDATIQHQRIYVYEVDKQIVAVAKLDLELHSLVEIGGVYTFPEFRNKGYGAGIVREVARRIRAAGKMPRLQVDEQNLPALRLYEKAGWQSMGKIARVWLTG